MPNLNIEQKILHEFCLKQHTLSRFRLWKESPMDPRVAREKVNVGASSKLGLRFSDKLRRKFKRPGVKLLMCIDNGLIRTFAFADITLFIKS